MARTRRDSLSALLLLRIQQHVREAGGWLPFDRFMAAALYEPGLGYYSRGSGQFGLLHGFGGSSDFVTAPELSPLFGAAIARQVAQALAAAAADEVWEFGAGTGALAAQLLQALPAGVRYRIVDLSGALRARQALRLAAFGGRVEWLDALPDALVGVVVGNEVLDAMPVQLLRWDGRAWSERGVALGGGGDQGANQGADADDDAGAAAAAFVWQDRPTALRPPVQAGFAPGTQTEIHPQAEAFVGTLGDRLKRGAAFFIDYGFPEREYYHPQRSGGTLVCHRGHRVETGADDPLADVGLKDITAHVDFSAIALAGQDAGLDVIGYTSQARFLLNCGLLDLLRGADIPTTAHAQKLLAEHEMGELFKVIGFARGLPGFAPLGFAAGDRTHTL